MGKNKRYYTSNRMGENIGIITGYAMVTKNLINEVGAAPTDGHRNNVFSVDFNEVGIGYLEGGEYRNYLTPGFLVQAELIMQFPQQFTHLNLPQTVQVLFFKAIYHNNTLQMQQQK